MAKLKLRRIDCAAADADLAQLRAQLSPQGDLVTPRGRELTEAVFGEALPPVRVVERICNDVRSRGLAAVLHYTEKFDRARLSADTIRVGRDELAEAHAEADKDFLNTVRRVRQKILSFQL